MKKYVLTRILPLGALYIIFVSVISYWIWWKLMSPVSMLLSMPFEIVHFSILLAILSCFAIIACNAIKQLGRFSVVISPKLVYAGVFFIGIIICVVYTCANLKLMDITNILGIRIFEAGMVKIVALVIVMVAESIAVIMVCKWRFKWKQQQ